jgi:hypothetical protein
MKTQIPFGTTSLFLTRVSLILLAFFLAVPKAPASDSPRATFLKNLLGEVERVQGPETALARSNTADGAGALQNLTTGWGNSAFGDRALNHNTIGGANNAMGVKSLFHNTQGTHNVANGVLALFANTTGIGNVGSGYGALYQNVSGLANTAFGALAGLNTTGELNVTLGAGAGVNITTGSENIALGTLAGSDVTTGDNNIDIGNVGDVGDSHTIRVGDPAVHTSVFLAGIGPMAPEFPNQVVLVDPVTGRLGTSASTGSLGGLGAVLFDYNSGTITIGVGGAVPFSQPPFIGSGTAISKNNDTTFMINANGVYRVSYTLRTAVLSLLANVQVHVNGAGVGPTAALAVAGTSLSDQVTFFANAGDTLQLVVGGVGLTLGTGDNATINIDKIQ